MRYYCDFPDTAGQYAGRHYFATIRERDAFIARAAARGVDIKAARRGATR